MNAETFNSRYPVGTPVFAYPGFRPEDDRAATRLVTRTRTRAQTSASGDPVVWVEGEGSYICLTHVDVVSEAVYQAAKLADAVAAQGALPMPVGAEPKQRTILDRARDALRARMAKDDLRLVLENVIAYAERLERKVASLKAEQDRDDAEYAEVIAERDRALETVAAMEAERHTTNEALDDAVRALRADRDQLARYEERLETLRALCDAAEHIGLVSGGWFTVEAIRRATDGEPLPKPDITARSYFRPAVATTQPSEEAS